MRNLSPEAQKILLLSVFIAIVIFVSNIFLVTLPLWNKYKEKAEKYASIERRLKQSRAKVKDKDLLVYIRNLKRQISDMEDRIVSDLDLTFVMEDISNVAKDSGLELKQILPKDSQPVRMKAEKHLKYAKLLFVGRGGYHELGRFISKLENGRYLCRIESIEIIPNISDYRHNDVKVRIAILSKEE